MTATKTLVGIVACAGLASVIHPRSINYEGRLPAPHPMAAELRTIAVLPFSGQNGSEFSANLTAELQAATLDGQPHFSVRAIEGATAPRSRGRGAQSEASLVSRLGQQLGVQAIYLGNVETSKATERRFSREDSYCAESKGLFKCKRRATRTVRCNQIDVSYSVTPRAIRVRDGRVVYSETITLNDSVAICDQDSESQATSERLLRHLQNAAARRIRQQVAPSNVVVKVKFKTRVTDVSKLDQEQLSNAIAFANASRLDRACGIIESMNTPANANSPGMLYNLGVCSEVMEPDSPVKALQFYSRADQLLSRPDSMISEAFLRMKNRVGTEKALKR